MKGFRLFLFESQNKSLKPEILTGLTSFLTVSYIFVDLADAGIPLKRDRRRYHDQFRHRFHTYGYLGQYTGDGCSGHASLYDGSLPNPSPPRLKRKTRLA